jgi:CRP-like cAMP-binding protein
MFKFELCNLIIMDEDSEQGHLHQVILGSEVGAKMLKKQAISVAQKPPGKRKDGDIQRIVDFFVFYNVFKNVYKSSDLYTLAQCAEYRLCHNNQVLFRQGDEPDGFYVIIKGKVKGGFTKVDSLVGKYFEEIDVLFNIKSGTGFGELAILKDKQRTVTVRAIKETHLLFINKKVYLEIACPMILKLINHNIELLRPLHTFGSFSADRLKEFCSISFEKQYSFDSVFNEQDKPPQKVYFIKSGIINGYRLLFASNLSQKTRTKHSAIISKLKFPLKLNRATMGKFMRQFTAH